MSSKNPILACVALLAVSFVATLVPPQAEAQRPASR